MRKRYIVLGGAALLLLAYLARPQIKTHEQAINVPPPTFEQQIVPPQNVSVRDEKRTEQARFIDSLIEMEETDEILGDDDSIDQVDSPLSFTYTGIMHCSELSSSAKTTLSNVLKRLIAQFEDEYGNGLYNSVLRYGSEDDSKKVIVHHSVVGGLRKKTYTMFHDKDYMFGGEIPFRGASSRESEKAKYIFSISMHYDVEGVGASPYSLEFEIPLDEKRNVVCSPFFFELRGTPLMLGNKPKDGVYATLLQTMQDLLKDFDLVKAIDEHMARYGSLDRMNRRLISDNREIIVY